SLNRRELRVPDALQPLVPAGLRGALAVGAGGIDGVETGEGILSTIARVAPVTRSATITAVTRSASVPAAESAVVRAGRRAGAGRGRDHEEKQRRQRDATLHAGGVQQGACPVELPSDVRLSTAGG